MKRMAWLPFMVLGSTAFVVAQNASVPKQMNAAVCNSACVTKVDNLLTCDRSCTDRSGHCVAVTDGGTLTNVADRQQCTGFTHQPTKTNAMRKKTESDAEKDLRDRQLYSQAP